MFEDKPCRLCLKVVGALHQFHIVNNERTMDLVKYCLPDLNLEATRDPLICTWCYNTLIDFEKIKRKTSITMTTGANQLYHDWFAVRTGSNQVPHNEAIGSNRILNHGASESTGSIQFLDQATVCNKSKQMLVNEVNEPTYKELLDHGIVVTTGPKEVTFSIKKEAQTF